LSKKKASMISAARLSINKLILVIPILAAGLWLLSQKGCVPDSDASPDPVTSSAGSHLSGPDLGADAQRHRLNLLERVGHSGLSGTPRQSLRNAATLLRSAADILDRNELRAVQLIRQVIAILKHQVIPSLSTPEVALVPIVSPASNTTDRISGESLVVQPGPMTPCADRNSEGPDDSPI
jgi:hypothetical protein